MHKFVIKKGNDEKIEKAYRDYVWLRDKANKAPITDSLSRGMFNSTYFIRLRAKKRRRYTKYKIQCANIDWARYKALGAVSKSFKEQLSTSRNFFSALEKVLEILQSGKSGILLNRDDYHKTAYKVMPYRWRKQAVQVKRKRIL